MAGFRNNEHCRVGHVYLLGADDHVAEVAKRSVRRPRAILCGERDEAGEHDAVCRDSHVEVVPACGVGNVEKGEEAETAVHGVTLLAWQRGQQGGEVGRVG